jgi:hypothetical protein
MTRAQLILELFRRNYGGQYPTELKDVREYRKPQPVGLTRYYSAPMNKRAQRNSNKP